MRGVVRCFSGRGPCEEAQVIGERMGTSTDRAGVCRWGDAEAAGDSEFGVKGRIIHGQHVASIGISPNINRVEYF